MSVQSDLKSLLQGEISTDEQTLTRYSTDASIFAVRPQVVVAPKDTEDIKNLVKYVNDHPGEKLSLTARSGGTDMTGGPLNDSIILDMTKHFNRLKNIGDHQATVEPGVFYRDFEAATLQKNLLMPSYPASKTICTVGGMVANNSGGEKTLMYGQTKQYVKKLKVVLSDGQEYTFEPLTKSELDAKLKLNSFEGEIYRQTYDLVMKNHQLLQAAKPKVSKNSTGYFLWDVWDGHRFDLTKLFVGSQGTLGIITEITFRLITPQPFSQLLTIFLSDLSILGKLVPTVLRYHPESFESYDDHTFKLAVRYLPDMLKRLSFGQIIAMLWQFLPEAWMIVTGGVPKLVLLAEFTGQDPKEISQRVKAAQAALQDFPVQLRHINNPAEMKKFWTVRRESFNLLRQHVHGKRTVPFIDDFIVNPQYLPEFLPQLDKILSQYKLIYTIAGHIGDGNFHIIPLMDLNQAANRQLIPELAQKVYDLVLKFGGSISGEHNDGLVRSHYLPKMYGQEVYDLFVRTKNIFDPRHLFNPRKKINSTWQYAQQHLITA